MKDLEPKLTPPPPLNEKERRVYKKLQDVPGLVLAHGVGTGKTRTSIQIASRLNKPTNIVVPAALQQNYEKELVKWRGGRPSNINIQSQQTAALRGLDNNKQDGLMVVDEAHRARDPKSRLLKALEQSKANKRLLLTATPIYNHPADIAPLINLAADKNVLPEDKAEFSKRFITEKKVDPGFLGKLLGVSAGSNEVLNTKNHELNNALKKYVDYQQGSTAAARAEGFPGSNEEVVKVPLHKNQQEIYQTIMGRAPFWTRYKVKRGLPPNKGELQTLQSFLTGARQVANSTWDFVGNKNKTVSPKVDYAVNYLKQEMAKNPRYKAVVYSNYLGSGLSPYKAHLDRNKIPYGEFSGQIPKVQRDQMVRDYNENKLKALLISSAGAEGLDLKGTRLLQILEPHFNREKEKQIIGRAIRYQSHAALPPAEQNVLIQRYLAQPKGSWFDRLMGKPTVRGTDEYISDIADRKERLNQQVMQHIAKLNK